MSDHDRRKLYNQLQMVLAGHNNTLAVRAALDLLATALAYEAETLESALVSCDYVAEDLRRSITLNWNSLQAARGQASAATPGNRPQ